MGSLKTAHSTSIPKHGLSERVEPVVWVNPKR